jgi:signal transduction histidine kinase
MVEENEMKQVVIATLAILLSLCLAGNVLAESATKEECIAKSKEAAKMIEENGLDAAVAEINKKDGKFVWKDTYVFLMDLDGNMLGHPMKPDLIGKNLMESTDKAEEGKEKMLFQEFVELAKTKGDGWVDYMWPKPGEDTPSKKISYIYRVPGKDLFVGAGIYE